MNIDGLDFYDAELPAGEKHAAEQRANADRRAGNGAHATDGAGASRPYVGILFECCGVYTRIYRKPEERRYQGACPRCGARVSVRVGSGGTSQRIFRAS